MILTAQQAKELVEKTYTDDFNEIMAKIENAANNGKTLLHLYEPMKPTTRQKLTDLGYDIPPMASIATQKDGLYHTIHWA